MGKPVQFIGVHSSEELTSLLPGILEEEGCETVLYRVGCWWNEDRFKTGIRQTRVLVADFDGTLVPGSQLEGLRAHMSERDRKEDLADASKYFAGEQFDADSAAFLFRRMCRLERSRLTREQVRNDVARQLPRAGVRQLFASYRRDGSAIINLLGMDTYVEEWAGRHDVEVSSIHALRTIWNGPFNELSFREEHLRWTTTRTANKSLSRELATGSHNHRDVLLLDDMPRGLARTRHPSNLCVLLVPRRDLDARRVEERMRQLQDPALFSAMDVVFVSDSLDYLVELRRQ